MGRIIVIASALLALSAAGAVLARGSTGSPAEQIQRTFVSTSGSDSNPCTPAAPCRSFTAALENTRPGGEVVAVDSGGYGPFTVDKAVTIAGAPGAHVAISVFSGTGITVDAGNLDTVVLRNLYVTGLGGAWGIALQAAGALHVESVVVSGFTARGLEATASAAGARLIVRESSFRHNTLSGLSVAGALHVEIEETQAHRNGFGFVFSTGATGSVHRSVASASSTGNGFSVQSGAVFTIAESVADGNAGAGVIAANAGSAATLTGLVLSNNAGQGLSALLGAVARIGGSTVTGNGTGLQQLSAGTVLETFGDNLVRGNTTEASGTITAVAKT